MPRVLELRTSSWRSERSPRRRRLRLLLSHDRRGGDAAAGGNIAGAKCQETLYSPAVTPVERIRQQFQDALADIEPGAVLERLKQKLPSLSLRELGELLQSPMARAVANVPARELLGSPAKPRTKA